MLVHLALIYFLRWEDLAEDEREKAKRRKERLSTSWRLSAKAFCNKKKHTVTEKNMVIEGNILIHRGKRKRRQRGWAEETCIVFCVSTLYHLNAANNMQLKTGCAVQLTVFEFLQQSHTSTPLPLTDFSNNWRIGAHKITKNTSSSSF